MLTRRTLFVFAALAAAGCGARTQLPLGNRGGASNNSGADAGPACLEESLEDPKTRSAPHFRHPPGHRN
jgi:hypothetical protein